MKDDFHKMLSTVVRDVHRSVVEEYRADVGRVLAENRRRLVPDREAGERNGFKLEVEKVVIPRMEHSPRGRFFLYTRSSLRTEDNPILRFIPYVRGEVEDVDLTDFRETTMDKDPYGLKEEIMKRMMERIVSTEAMAGLDGLDGGEETRESVVAREMSSLLGVDYEEVMDEYRRHESRKDTDATMRTLFCNVCLVFDCKWHQRIDGVCVKPVGFEKDPRNAHTTARDVCGEECRMVEVSSVENKTNIQDLAHGLRNELSDIYYNQAQGFACIASLVFYLRHKRYVPCASIREFLGTAPRRLKFAMEGTPRTRIDPGAFFTPCAHQGYCNLQNGCQCVRNKTNCEVSCLCIGCRNFFAGCTCSMSCGGGCACVRASRECTSVCSCRKCRNMQLQTTQEAQTFVAASRVSGQGLFAGEDIERDRFVIEYVGEIIGNEEAERRGALYDMKKCSYLFDLCTRNGMPVYSIDAGVIGNNSRFINHSRRNANLRARICIVYGVRRIGFYAARRIDRYEELFFDYNYNEEHKTKHNIVD